MIDPRRLAISDLAVSIAGQVILHPMSATFNAGEFTSVIGPNGAGKSTLLKGLLGLITASGSVQLGSARIDTLEAKLRARQIAYLPQGHEAHWPISARAIVALGRFPHGASDPDRLSATDAACVDAAMQAAHVSHLADRVVTTLSGGERARVALARCLAVGAAILLCDEPTAALDPGHQLGVMQTLRACARQGQTVIGVTHDLALAARFADRIIMLHEGKVIADGAPVDVLTPDLLRQVYGIEAFITKHLGETALLPWARLP